jgi:antitoxin HigA-1
MEIKKFKRRPTSPGEILKEEFLLPLGLTQKIVADHIEVDIKVINRLVNGKTTISPALALKLAAAFDTTPEFWLNAQLAVDLYDANLVIGNELPGKLHRAS